MIPIYIGYDQRESIAYFVLMRSLLRRSSERLEIKPINLDMAGDAYTRPRQEHDSTDFSMARFMVPYMQQYKGWAIFMDCDMLCMADIAELWEQRNDRYAVMVKKHQHEPEEKTKFLGQEQSRYGRKNWSSLMLMNCEKLQALTPHYVNTVTPGFMAHQFRFLEDDQIGDITGHWNHLVDYDPWVMDPKLVHYTKGGPWFHETSNCGYAAQWLDECRDCPSLQHWFGPR